jgi:CheY-like chemotaxis protein
VREKAFDPFFTTKGLGAGTGLGLSMVYGFAKQSGGNIQLQSEPGHGTSVRIFLPASRSKAGEQMPDLDTVETASMPGGREKLLVVEDDPRVRRVVVARLAALGYQVIEAATGTEALDQLEKHDDIALLFTDIVMPNGMTGIELADKVKMAKPSIKVLFTSGYAEPTIAGRELAQSGRWLRKPHSARDLAIVLRELLD